MSIPVQARMLSLAFGAQLRGLCSSRFCFGGRSCQPRIIKMYRFRARIPGDRYSSNVDTMGRSGQASRVFSPWSDGGGLRPLLVPLQGLQEGLRKRKQGCWVQCSKEGREETHRNLETGTENFFDHAAQAKDGAKGGKMPYTQEPWIISALKYCFIFLLEQPGQLRYIEWPSIQSTITMALLTVIAVTFLIIFLATVDSTFSFILSSILRRVS